MAETATNQDRVLVAVSDYNLADSAPGLADTVHTRRRGEVKRIAAGAARGWTNVSSEPSQVVVVSLR